MKLPQNRSFPINEKTERRAMAGICLAILVSMPVTSSFGQDTVKEPEVETAEPDAEELVTVKGQFVQDPDQLQEFALTELKAELLLVLKFNQPELPADWSTMTVEQREKWITDYEASDEGKALIAANQKLIAERTIIELEIESDGKFVAYDVPRGEFQLQAVTEKEQDGKTFVVQAFGQIMIGEVDEMQLGEMPLEVIRLLKMGEEAPGFSGETFDGEQVSLSALRGKHVLLNFALLGNNTFDRSLTSINESLAHPELDGKLAVLTVSVDEDSEAASKFIAEKAISWPCLSLGGWDASVLNEYGVKSVPSLWLIDTEGKIILTGQQFVIELNRTGSSLPQLIDDAIAGRLVIGGEAGEDDQD